MTDPDASRNGNAAKGAPIPAGPAEPAARPEPGDRPPITRLDRPPSDRYRPAATDAAIAVFKWHRRLAGDARKRNPVIRFIYKGA